MTNSRVRLCTPRGKPFWLIYGVRRVSDGTMLYIGRTTMPLWVRWSMHGLAASYDRPRYLTPILAAIRSEGAFAFHPEELACCLDERDAAWTENNLIVVYDTLHPRGLNSAAAIKGGGRSADFKERHKLSLMAAYAKEQTDPIMKAKRRENARRNGHKTWEQATPEERTKRVERLKGSKEKARAAVRRSWSDPETRPAKLAALKVGQQNSARNRSRHATIKDSRQKGLL